MCDDRSTQVATIVQLSNRQSTPSFADNPVRVAQLPRAITACNQGCRSCAAVSRTSEEGAVLSESWNRP